ncbi:glycoside hydrolase family 43 protein [Modestobacter roseus]|uniref:Beta-xylosidase n=1 Tax=Modestobacter roseus TaxID=1181884 RepID=A0A562IM38_9ACTN|nr:glycoside hydrolase family 43 protein [Modestobacter roseus]MQA33758.1 family 43 glycosylhydrolase [Modestobacter roseus]TWH72059.1 beta-xylosidase [Modestobacter roseus]
MSAIPILPGFHPDPSICRVGDTYYLATSSFEYAPGVPLFSSRDLLRWEQIGNVLDRPSQLNVRPGLASASSGVYAPTLRHHAGRFWLATTNIADIRLGHLLVHAEDSAGPWSEPVYTAGTIGVDPDLAWDDDGTCLLTWSDPFGGVAQAVLLPSTGRLGSEPRPLWAGSGLAHPEGPHLFRRDGWWYLVVAEGGTGRGHGVSVARARSATGPFEGHPTNPVFSHRSTGDPVQNTGHADLVELRDGSWAVVHLGVRPRGSFPQYHVNGRETFLAGVDWVDGWPVVVEDRFEVPEAVTAFVDDFSGDRLHPRWISPGVQPQQFAAVRPGGGIQLAAGRPVSAREAERLLAVRARDEEWTVEVTVTEGDVALTVRIDDAHWVAVERCGGALAVRMAVGPLDQVLATATDVSPDRPLVVRAVAAQDRRGRRSGPDRLELGWVDEEGVHVLAGVDGRYLSTEVAGGFTGRVIGVEALGGPAVLTRFEYRTS